MAERCQSCLGAAELIPGQSQAAVPGGTLQMAASYKKLNVLLHTGEERAAKNDRMPAGITHGWPFNLRLNGYLSGSVCGQLVTHGATPHHINLGLG